MEKTVCRIRSRPGSSAKATAGREHSLEAVGRRSDSRQSDVTGCAIKKILEPWRRWQVVEYLSGSYRVSERHACRVARRNRGTFRYRGHKDPRTALRMRIREIAQTRVRYGYRKISCATEPRGLESGQILGRTP